MCFVHRDVGTGDTGGTCPQDLAIHRKAPISFLENAPLRPCFCKINNQKSLSKGNSKGCSFASLVPSDPVCESNTPVIWYKLRHHCGWHVYVTVEVYLFQCTVFISFPVFLPLQGRGFDKLASFRQQCDKCSHITKDLATVTVASRPPLKYPISSRQRSTNSHTRHLRCSRGYQEGGASKNLSTFFRNVMWL